MRIVKRVGNKLHGLLCDAWTIVMFLSLSVAVHVKRLAARTRT